MEPLNVYKLHQMLMGNADLLSCAIIRRQNPIKDLMTRNELYKEFGRREVDKRIAPRGKIEGRKCGSAPNSPIKYSRMEFVALLEAERMMNAEVTNWVLKD